VAPLEPWEKAIVDMAAFSEDVHGKISCTYCHGGVNSEDKEAAHEGLIAYPSDDPESTCGSCHWDLIFPQTQSLHYTLAGYDTSLAARSQESNSALWEPLQEMQANHCDSCHTTCGQCHVSQPASVGGGLLSGHEFVATPPMSRTCTACHGSRVGNEYLGRNEGVMADVHFRQARMVCVDCHDAAELHGPLPGATDPGQGPASINHRYDGLQQPRCEDCHQTVGGEEDTIPYHTVHGDALSCQVCHSASYKNCYGCHTRLSAEGIPFFEIQESQMGFFIGLNPLQSSERPYTYVPLRHVPIEPDSFSDYGDDLLPNFSGSTTWRYATPHNIQRITPQAESCGSCHGNQDLFLTVEKILAGELEANLPVVVERIPE
jgi:hypothetical protein